MAQQSTPSASDSRPHDPSQTPPTRILLPVNQSSINGYPNPSISCATAFDWILNKLIRSGSRKDFRLFLLHVQVHDDDDVTDLDSLYATSEDFKSVKQDEESRGVHLLRSFVKRCNELEVPCKAWIKQGDPKEVICKEVERVHPDILVLGSRGLGTLQRLFVGTISEYCTKHASCPVLVIKRKPADCPEDPADD